MICETERGEIMKNLKKWALRTLAALLALAMLIGVPAGPRGRAAAAAAGGDGGAAEMGIRLVSGLVSTIVEATPEAAVAAVVEWGIGEILAKAFGSDMNEEERQYFNQILSEIAKLQDSVSTLQTTLELQGLDSLLNSYKNLASNQTPSVIYRALLRIDEAEATEEWKRQERLSLLTDSIGAGEGNLADIDLPFDQYANAILNAMTINRQNNLDDMKDQGEVLEAAAENGELEDASSAEIWKLSNAFLNNKPYDSSSLHSLEIDDPDTAYLIKRALLTADVIDQIPGKEDRRVYT